jgi:hypothetical protein
METVSAEAAPALLLFGAAMSGSTILLDNHRKGVAAA